MSTPQEAKLEKLKTLLEISNDGLTRSEFVENFKLVITQILGIEKKVLERINQTIDDLKSHQDRQNLAIEGDLRGLTAKFEQSINKALKEQENSLNFIKDKMRRIESGKDGLDGKDGKDAIIDEPKIIQAVMDKIKIPELPELEVADIKGLKETLERLETQRRLGGGGGFSKIAMESKFIDDETPSGTVNGITTAFTITNAPNPSGSLKVYVNGMRIRITEDYTFSGKTITFLTAPPTGSILLVDYRK